MVSCADNLQDDDMREKSSNSAGDRSYKIIINFYYKKYSYCTLIELMLFDSRVSRSAANTIIHDYLKVKYIV